MISSQCQWREPPLMLHRQYILLRTPMAITFRVSTATRTEHLLPIGIAAARRRRAVGRRGATYVGQAAQLQQTHPSSAQSQRLSACRIRNSCRSDNKVGVLWLYASQLLPIARVLELVEFASKPEQLGPSSSICLEAIYIWTQTPIKSDSWNQTSLA